MPFSASHINIPVATSDDISFSNTSLEGWKSTRPNSISNKVVKSYLQYHRPWDDALYFQHAWKLATVTFIPISEKSSQLQISNTASGGRTAVDFNLAMLLRDSPTIWIAGVSRMQFPLDIHSICSTESGKRNYCENKPTPAFWNTSSFLSNLSDYSWWGILRGSTNYEWGSSRFVSFPSSFQYTLRGHPLI